MKYCCLLHYDNFLLISQLDWEKFWIILMRYNIWRFLTCQRFRNSMLERKAHLLDGRMGLANGLNLFCNANYRNSLHAINVQKCWKRLVLRVLYFSISRILKVKKLLGICKYVLKNNSDRYKCVYTKRLAFS